MKNISHNHSIALYLASQHGLKVFPCRETETSYVDKRTGKRVILKVKAPYVPGGFKSATTDIEKINEHWGRHPNALVGVPTGIENALLVVDIDSGHGKVGEESFLETGLKIPKTVQTRTMSGGRHIIFQYPQGYSIKNFASTKFGRDVDLRAEGGYVIWAGSKLQDGTFYEAVPGLSLDEVDIADLPQEYLHKIQAPTSRNEASKVCGALEGTRNDTLFRHAIRSVHGGLTDEAVYGASSRLNETFNPPLERDELEKVVQSANRYRKNTRFPYTDLGNAERLRAAWQGRIVFIREHKTWAVFNGQRWVLDDAAAARMAHETVRQIANEAVGGDPDELQQGIRWQKTSEASARIRALLEIASQLEGLSVSQDVFDAKRELLNFTNGTLDLKTGVFREAKPEDMITKLTGCAWDPNAECPRFLKFIQEVTDGNAEDAEYIQKLAGYILSGDRREQILQFLVGDGGDGKSTFIETIKKLVGDYQTTLAATSISAANTAAIPNDIAKLSGKRLATISELPQKLHVNTQLVKAISGGDTLTARFLHKEYFDFEPTIQLLIATNFYPYADPEDKAYFRRLAILRFPVSFTDKKPDKDLKSKLVLELSGIAVWAVEGYRNYLKKGLSPTQSMYAELVNYRRFTDPLSGFFENAVLVTYKEKDFVPTDHLIEEAKKYCGLEDRPQPDRGYVIRYMEQRGFTRSQRRYGNKRIRGFTGLKLSRYEEDDVPF